MTSQERSSDAVIFPTALDQDPTLNERYAITLPFVRYRVQRKYSWKTDDEETEDEETPFGRQGCIPTNAFVQLKLEKIEQTKKRWAWFLEAEDLDKERGTQLGTLGFLPKEIREMIMRKVFSDRFNKKIYFSECRTTARGEWVPNDRPDPPPWRKYNIRNASTSLKVEFEYVYLTMRNFEFLSTKALLYFLRDLTPYQESLLRSVTVRLSWVPLSWGPPWGSNFNSSRNAGCKAWLDNCAKLPSGLISIKFQLKDDLGVYSHYLADMRHLVDSLDILGSKIKRCWAPRAKISIDSEVTWYDDRNDSVIVLRHIASALCDLDPWSPEWLEWWTSSQDCDSAEGQCPPLEDPSGSSQDVIRDVEGKDGPFLLPMVWAGYQFSD